MTGAIPERAQKRFATSQLIGSFEWYFFEAQVKE
jgi:hypothetical protein